MATSDKSLLFRLSTGLSEAGFTIIEADDGQLALDVCEKTPPSVAILDYDLPTIAGIEIAERLRDSKRLPLVMLSNHGDDSIVHRAFAAGAMTYLIKPVSAARLIPTIETALRQFVELEALRTEAVRLADKVNRVKSTSLAVGLLMAKLDLSEQDAYDRLRSFARSKSSKVNDVALELLSHAIHVNSVVSEIGAITTKTRRDAQS